MIHGTRAVVLFSGGMDSTTLLALACWTYREVHPLAFQYGQRHQIELVYAQRIVAAAGLPWRWVEIDSTTWSTESALLARSPDRLPVGRGPAAIQHGGESPAIVPARNLLFLGYGIALAASLGGADVLIGCNADDASGFPDCRVETLSAMATAAREGARCNVVAPFARLAKSQIVALGQNLGVDYARTWSCYRPSGSEPCGGCDACALRAAAEREAGIWP
jgi:7-cyano-7-deazaguanine synthase